MAGPAKRRAQAEKETPATSDSHGSGGNAGRGAVHASSPKSIPRVDGNRDPADRAPIEYSRPNDLKNLSEFLGLAGWYAARGRAIPESLPQRQGLNTRGREALVALNTFNVNKYPVAIVHQYDVSWGPETDATKRVLLKKIWASKAVKEALGEPKQLWIYDGNKLAWSGFKLNRDELRIIVDLDKEQGRAPPSSGKKNVHKVFIKHTRTIDFSGLTAFMNGKAGWSGECIDTINFLDHVLREGPSQKFTQIKKSFFQRGEQRFDLGGGVEAFKGVFASLRPVLTGDGRKILSINVDVANGTFWRAQPLGKAVLDVLGLGNPAQFVALVQRSKADWDRSKLKKDLARFKRVGVTDNHRRDVQNQWTIDSFVKEDCHEATFADPDKNGKRITVFDYYKDKYNIKLMAGLPLVKVTKKIRGGSVFLPIEYLKIDPNQRFNSKLDDKQTSQMIRFAVTLPNVRRQAIMEKVALLDWKNDPYLRHFGIDISTDPTVSKARILPVPQLGFGPANRPSVVPGSDLVQGRWRLDGKKFFAPQSASRTLDAWGVCAIQGKFGVNPEQVQAFIKNFIRIYEGHGGRFGPKGKQPYICPGNLADGGELVAKAYNATGNKFNARPMFMMFIVNDRNVDVYRRIKKSCDCRFGVPSQVLQSKHVQANQGQYISNVCLKVHAKLGGYAAVTKSTLLPTITKQPGPTTMIIGADVSHPAPGAGSDERASFAAMTMACDKDFVRYWAQCQTNGNRVEMVTTQNIYDHIGDMAKAWMSTLNQGHPPQRVLYIRDGVSEGQYAAVLEEEVRDIKDCFAKLGVALEKIPKFTVVIAGKRHHIRFFPQKGDRNNNPIPGTLVETGCTHPFEFDFYLCSHVAIKGTARPIHYQCILNEGMYKQDELQQLLFEHSYQYVRSTSPVSLHPAVYYAHLAADRCRAHTNENPVSSGKKEAKAEKKSTTGSSNRSVEVRPLMEMAKVQGLKETMWFV
ncbi:Piwi-domain-containing protein [Sporormia fimetaria CBS 119925]|uniref:Piwi-domain-containing protein n=1 Tax=Sporormia fimetaria CBS 119925 TaxID=1340428 RepID=A0A6A6VCX3_9PLEO|nr:Piwi-domain-containing protein [Sporormia fimetaria CBS 119925]